MFDGEHVRLSNGRSGYMSQIEREATKRCVRSAVAVRHDTTALFPAKWSNHALSFSRLTAGAPFLGGAHYSDRPLEKQLCNRNRTQRYGQNQDFVTENLRILH